MAVIRFAAYVLGWLLAPLAIIVLGVLWLMFYLTLATYQTWLRAKRDPRYDEYWWVN